MTSKVLGLFATLLTWLINLLVGARPQVTWLPQQVALTEAGRYLANCGIGNEDIAIAVHRRHFIHYPASTISAFLEGTLSPEMLAYKVIKHTIQEAFGMEIIHDQNFQPVADATQGKEV